MDTVARRRPAETLRSRPTCGADPQSPAWGASAAPPVALGQAEGWQAGRRAGGEVGAAGSRRRTLQRSRESTLQGPGVSVCVRAGLPPPTRTTCSGGRAGGRGKGLRWTGVKRGQPERGPATQAGGGGGWHGSGQRRGTADRFRAVSSTSARRRFCSTARAHAASQPRSICTRSPSSSRQPSRHDEAHVLTRIQYSSFRPAAPPSRPTPAPSRPLQLRIHEAHHPVREADRAVGRGRVVPLQAARVRARVKEAWLPTQLLEEGPERGQCSCHSRSPSSTPG